VHELPAPEAWIPADNALQPEVVSVQECAGFYKENGKGGEINE